ncbi:MAG TPA: outer membrane protein [Phycisphaerae bacterium]|nr:outer membrane protein [Phycisphaerae bacterium]
MKRVLLAGAGLFALAVAAQPAAAADVPIARPIHKAPVAPPIFDWTGWYGGVNAGVGISQTRAATVGELGSFDRSGAGFTGGVQGGYNWQFNPHWVAGLEGDIGWLGIDRSFQHFDATIRVSGVKTDWYGTIRGRLGYTSSPSLFYVTGGAAFVNVKNNADDVGGTPLPASKSGIASGWTVGGGIETMLGGNWSARAEYLYIDAGSQDVFNSDFGELIRFDNRFHVFRYGLNHRFGGTGMRDAALPSYNWTGFYVGAHAGAGLSQVHATAPIFNSGAVDIAGAGFTGGIQGGYNWQISRAWVAGIEADFAWLGIDRSLRSWDSIFTAFGVKTDWYGTIRGRVGYSTGPALLYVTGGAAWVKVENNFDRLNPGTLASASKSETATGWTVGGGIEAALAQNWTAKIEYLYIDAGSQDVFNPLNGTAHFDNHFHVFRFGLNYQFATGKAPVVTRY